MMKRFLATAAAVLLVAGCESGSSGTPIPTPTPAPNSGCVPIFFTQFLGLPDDGRAQFMSEGEEDCSGSDCSGVLFFEIGTTDPEEGNAKVVFYGSWGGKRYCSRYLPLSLLLCDDGTFEGGYEEDLLVDGMFLDTRNIDIHMEMEGEGSIDASMIRTDGNVAVVYPEIEAAGCKPPS